MKKIVLAFVTLLSMTAWAGPGHYPASTSSGLQNELTANLGFQKGAVNLGADYERRMDGFGFGGYLDIQTDKDKSGSKIVYQSQAFGADIKVHLVDNAKVDAYMAPGFGFVMWKDIPDGSSKSDVIAVGPSLRLGVMIPLSPTMKAGLSRLEAWNWFDDKAGTMEVYQAALAFAF